MRRDYFTLELENVDRGDDDEPAKPAVIVEFDGPAALLEERLLGVDEDPLEAREIDVAFRLQSAVDEPDATGVFSVTNRVTGDFVLEVNADADAMLSLVDAARTFGDAADADDGRYRLTVRKDGEVVLEHDKDTFLVYDRDGSLLRQHSLIPSGVEL